MLQISDPVNNSLKNPYTVIDFIVYYYMAFQDSLFDWLTSGP